ncbi:hypothetical protein IM40_01080 [Candidatus Paracaedimonas acanthamoebae]|nr:hypothetical protein IM40_01080 [Candidatus Paracaedimonas acanthamoebae]
MPLNITTSDSSFTDNGCLDHSFEPMTSKALQKAITATNEDEELQIAITNSLETKEAEDIQSAINASFSIPVTP